jgi:hypothetical protein
MGNADFDPGPGTTVLPSNGGWDVFVLKLDPSGNLVWVRSCGGIEEDHASEITADSGGLYVVGRFRATVDFDPGPSMYTLSSNGEEDAIIWHLDTLGVLLWAKGIGGSGSDMGLDLIAHPSGNLYATGAFQQTVDFDPGGGVLNLTANGGYDFFALSLGCNTQSVDAIEVCDSSYTWIDGNTYWSNNDSASYQFIDSLGCVHMVTLDLTLTTLDTSVTQTGITLVANASGMTYQWVDCGSGYSSIAGQTGQSFTPTVDGSYAVVVQWSSCVDTSRCFTVSGLGLNERNLLEGLKVYPNPTTSTIVIKGSALERVVQVEVIDPLGRVISTKTIMAGGALEAELGEMSGLYMVGIIDSNGTCQHVKAVKE